MNLNDSPLGLAPQPIGPLVLMEKYAKGAETTVLDVRNRVACAVASVEDETIRSEWAVKFLEAQQGGFIPAGRINAAAGTELLATLINCFVQPVGDAIAGYVEDLPGIFTALQQATETMRRGGGVGYDFTHIRPIGAIVKDTASRASGPVSYMRVFDRACETVESVGARRAAQMGVMRCDHPDIETFVHSKDKGDMTNFNISISVTDAFMEAVSADTDWELVHNSEPSDDFKAKGAYQRADGMWVYRKMRARDLWDQVMQSTYDHAEPGIIFIDKANRANNLNYVEVFEATNPCAEQFLPAYGCCDLGSLNLTLFVANAFEKDAYFDFERFAKVIPVAVRMLDNVLDLTYWPLGEQKSEAMSKRRIGLGFTGLGSALAMLGLRYDHDEARAMAAKIAETMRNEAYLASVELAKEKGAFPLFEADLYLAAPQFASGLPEHIKQLIREHGIRNSHLLSIAPEGTISLAFADNASNGIEPIYSLTYTRKKRMPDGNTKEYAVEDYAYRLYRHKSGNVDDLPASFVTALEISAMSHLLMVEAVAPFIDSAISKTVNVAKDYPYDDFKSLYMEAWKRNLKGLATYRPNTVLGAVLSASSEKDEATLPNDLVSDIDRRIILDKAPSPALASLRWPGRPDLPEGNMAWTYLVKRNGESFAISIGEVQNGRPHPFEVWVNGSEQPRGLGAVAKTLSMDMRTLDPLWVQMKLNSLIKTVGDDSFMLAMPPNGGNVKVPSVVSGFAQVIRYRLLSVGALNEEGTSPMIDALITKSEPKSGTNGTMTWSVDVHNPATGDSFDLGVKELVMPNGQRRPYSVRLAGVYPRVLDGLCALLSIDMRVVDPAWIGEKLRKLIDFQEPMGDFIAFQPGKDKQQTYPSTVAYIAALVLHRYAMLGILDESGHPISTMGVFDTRSADVSNQPEISKSKNLGGEICGKCGIATVHKVDGHDRCVLCGDAAFR